MGKSKTFRQKVLASFMGASIFLLVSHPETYKLTDSLVNALGGTVGSVFNNMSQCPTVMGSFLHMVVFFILSYCAMNMRQSFKKNEDDRLPKNLALKYTFYSTLMWFLVANPQTYKLVNGLTGNIVANANGCPNNNGLMLHGLVYFALLVGVMYFPKDRC